MAIHIQSGKNNLDCNLKNSKIQSVPFKIHADCDAPISAYFEPYVKTCENEILTASFRGYPLKGKQIEIPEGYVGVVLHESLRPSREKDERKFYVVNKFKEITFWNWDKVPSKNDAFLKAMDWIDIAEAKSGESLQEFEADVARLVRLAHTDTPEKIVERLAVWSFLDGLRENDMEQMLILAHSPKLVDALFAL